MKTIAEVIAEHRPRIDSARRLPRTACSCGWSGPPTGSGVTVHAAHVAQSIREARTVRTVEELDALPEDTIIRDVVTDILAKLPGGFWDYFADADPTGLPPESVGLPARVLWTPGDEQ